MSYAIYIGEAGIYPSPDELPHFDPTETPTVVVRKLELPEAPLFPGQAFDRTNMIMMGYGGWHITTRLLGLWELFFDSGTGLMRQHPGAAVLTEEHLLHIHVASGMWQASHRDAVAQYGTTEADGILASALWLKWWVTWALEYCRVPTIYNS